MDKITETNQVPQDRFPPSEKIELGSDGWLSPKGNFYQCGTTEHDESAEYLIENSAEAKLLEQQVIDSAGERKSYDERPDREKLKYLHWVLIRGSVLRSDDALNYTPEQLKKISDAGIKIVSAHGGSKEYSSQELIEKLNSIKTKLEGSSVIREVERQLPKLSSLRKHTIEDIHAFINDPLHESIFIGEFGDYFLNYQEGGHEVLPAEVFNILSSGFSEEMTINIGRYIRRFRATNLEDGEKLIVERQEYHHGGQSRETAADIENTISMFVADAYTIRNKFERLIYGGVSDDEKTPKIKLSKPDGYFADIVKGIMTS